MESKPWKIGARKKWDWESFTEKEHRNRKNNGKQYLYVGKVRAWKKWY